MGMKTPLINILESPQDKGGEFVPDIKWENPA
jgi:hypothetical protein